MSFLKKEKEKIESPSKETKVDKKNTPKKTKNVKIKRSKTKLEDEIPIPNTNLFQTPSQVEIIGIIRYIASNLIENSVFIDFSKFIKLKELSPITYSQIKNEKIPRKIIDILIFTLFDLPEKDIDNLIEKYY